MRKILLSLFVIGLCLSAQTAKPRVTLDEFFNSVDIQSLKISPDGSAVVIGTSRADWKHDRFRSDLWLWRNGALTLLNRIRA